jgi:hypothetical protein
MFRRVRTDKIFLAWLRFLYLLRDYLLRDVGDSETAWLSLIEPELGPTGHLERRLRSIGDIRHAGADPIPVGQVARNGGCRTR